MVSGHRLDDGLCKQVPLAGNADQCRRLESVHRGQKVWKELVLVSVRHVVFRKVPSTGGQQAVDVDKPALPSGSFVRKALFDHCSHKEVRDSCPCRTGAEKKQLVVRQLFADDAVGS